MKPHEGQLLKDYIKFKHMKITDIVKTTGIKRATIYTHFEKEILGYSLKQVYKEKIGMQWPDKLYRQYIDTENEEKKINNKKNVTNSNPHSYKVNYQTKTNMNKVLLLNEEDGSQAVKDTALAVYDTHVLTARFETAPVAWINYPGFFGSETIIRAKGDRMSGLIKENDWIGLKKIIGWREFIVPQGIYMIVTQEFEILNYAEMKLDTVIATSENNRYHPIDIPVDKILEIWALKASTNPPAIKTF